MGDLSSNFNRSEFRCPCGCGADHVSMVLIGQLQRLRNHLRRPIIINSGVRCPKYNATIGGKHNSAHLDGDAADIACIDSHTRWQMKRIIHFWELFNRIGTGETFLHVDVSPTLPQEVEWNYPTKEA